MECPKGHGRQAIVQMITADGKNPIKMSQVIANRLACGCVVGGEQYEKFKAAVTEIESEVSTKVRDIEEDARQRKAAVYQSFIVGKGGQKHAE